MFIRIAPTVYEVEENGVKGHVVQGQLHFRYDGTPFLKGKEWYVVGYEHQPFPTQADAIGAFLEWARALSKYHLSLDSVSRMDGQLLINTAAKLRRKRKKLAILREAAGTAQLSTYRKTLRLMRRLAKKTGLGLCVPSNDK